MSCCDHCETIRGDDRQDIVIFTIVLGSMTRRHSLFKNDDTFFLINTALGRVKKSSLYPRGFSRQSAFASTSGKTHFCSLHYWIAKNWFKSLKYVYSITIYFYCTFICVWSNDYSTYPNLAKSKLDTFK